MAILRFTSLKAASDFEQKKVNQAQLDQLLALGSIAAALPLCAFGGLKKALPVLGFGLFKLFTSRQKENDAFAAAKYQYSVNPNFVPKMNYPRPRPWN